MLPTPVSTRTRRRRWAVVLPALALLYGVAATDVGAEAPSVTAGTPAIRGPNVHLIGPGGANLPPGSTTGPQIPAPNHVDKRGEPAKGADSLVGSPGIPPRDALPASSASTSFWGMAEVPPGSYSWGVPPDTSLARGPNRVIELVNRRARLSNSAGSVYATRDLNSFFGAVDGSGNPSGSGLFDPKVFYDRNSTYPRFYAIALQGNDNYTLHLSRIYLAVSRSTGPSSLTTGWCRYYLSTRRALGSATDTWADYPGLGIGRDALVVTTNQYTWPGVPRVAQGVIWAWAKESLANNSQSCPGLAAPYKWIADGLNHTLPTTIQPAQHYTSPTSSTGVVRPVYLLNTVQGTKNYGVWRIANVASGNPLLWGPLTLAGTWPNYVPPNAPGGDGHLIETGDTRMIQVAGLANTIIGAHNTRCQWTALTAYESCVRLVRFSVGSTAGGGLTASLTQQVVSGGGDGWFYFYPSIALNNAGTLVSAFDVSSVEGYLGSAWGVKRSTEVNFSQVTWLTQGTCLRDTGRAGDYSGAEADPDGVRVWVAAERSAQITGVGCGWQTRIAAITP
jgi:hypothetical protein